MSHLGRKLTLPKRQIAVLQTRHYASLIWTATKQVRTMHVIPLARPRRAVRPDDWSRAKVVTFIVTLAATRSVTLAARAAGMSRKAAYGLRTREPHFAEAWRQALAAPPARRQGDKVEEVEDPPVSPGQGNNRRSALPRAAQSRDRRRDDRLRRAFFERLDTDLLLRTNALSLQRKRRG
jgi:hypothetical protein